VKAPAIFPSRNRFELRTPLVVAALYVAAACALLAQTFPKPAGHINDFAGVLSPEMKTQLENLTTELKEKTGAEVAVAIVKSLEGDTVESYANQLAESWGVGDKQDRGALLLLAVQDRQMRLEVGYGLEPILTDAMAGEVLDQVTTYLRRGDYDSGIGVGVSRVAQIIAADAGVRLTGMPRFAPATRARRRGVPGGWLTLLFILPFLLLPRRRRYGGWRGNAVTTAWMLGSLGGLGRRGSGGGRGGFGGGGFGGGGFGGFGGGGFGGGGASRSW
jgi:uncharacterized protein